LGALLDDQRENVIAAQAFGWQAVSWTTDSHLALARYPIQGGA